MESDVRLSSRTTQNGSSFLGANRMLKHLFDGCEGLNVSSFQQRPVDDQPGFLFFFFLEVPMALLWSCWYMTSSPEELRKSHFSRRKIIGLLITSENSFESLSSIL